MDENEYGKIWIVVFKGNALIDYSVLNYWLFDKFLIAFSNSINNNNPKVFAFGFFVEENKILSKCCNNGELRFDSFVGEILTKCNYWSSKS